MKQEKGIGLIMAIIGILIAIILITIIGVGLSNFLNNSTTDETVIDTTDNDSTVIKDDNSNTVNIADYSLYTMDVPASQRDIYYYWNINTDAFDKTIFDGKISVFGTIVSGELNGKTIKESGFTIGSVSKTSIENLIYDYDESYYTYGGYVYLYKDDIQYPSHGHLSIRNYNGISDPYDETSEIYFYNNTIYQDVYNLIVPYMQDVDYENITIDEIIDNLGVPTYVEGRTSDFDNAGTSLGMYVFSYVYVYDNYAFEFAFEYNEKIGVEIVSFIYEGKHELAKTVEIPKFDDNDELVYDTYDSSIEYWEYQQKMYLESIGKN